MLDWIAFIFQYPMQWFYSLTGNNYLLALVLFALFVKLLMLPLSIKQQKSQIKGAKLRPKIAIIEKKYKGVTDQNALREKQQEIMELQQREGYSPFGGCLSLLIQMPVFLGLYQVVRKPISYIVGASGEVVEKLVNYVKSFNGYENASGENQIQLIADLFELKAPVAEITGIEGFELPNLWIGNWMNLGATPSVSNFNWLLLIPVLSFVFSFLSMKITRKLNSPVMTSAPESDMSMKIMDWTMPLMSVFISFTLPAAFGVYWLFGYVFGIIQTLALAKWMPLPTFTPEELAQYEREMKLAARANKYGRPLTNDHNTASGRIRSLHHIDDDDYEQPAPEKQQGKAGAKKGGVESAPMKKDKE